jgi:hypothetical protein
VRQTTTTNERPTAGRRLIVTNPRTSKSMSYTKQAFGFQVQTRPTPLPPLTAVEGDGRQRPAASDARPGVYSSGLTS